MLGHVCPQRRQQPWKDHQCSSVRRPPSRATFPLHPSHIRTVTIDLHDRSSPPWAAMTLQHSCTRAGNPPSAACPGVSRAPQVCYLHRSGPPFKRHFNIPHRWPHGQAAHTQAEQGKLRHHPRSANSAPSNTAQDPEVSCEARCAEDLIARLSDGQMKADGALLLSSLG